MIRGGPLDSGLPKHFDHEWALEQLFAYVNGCAALRDFTVISRDSLDRAILDSKNLQLLRSKVLAILHRAIPDWQELYFDAVEGSDDIVEAAAWALIAELMVLDETFEHLGRPDASPHLVASSLHEVVWLAAAAQWASGHRHEAVLAAWKAVNSLLQAKFRRRDISDTELVNEAFGEGSPTSNRPRLRFDEDERKGQFHLGVQAFGRGIATNIRNPIAHIPNDELEISEQEALERLAAISLFARWVDQAAWTDGSSAGES